MANRFLVDPDLGPILDTFPDLQFTNELLPQLRQLTIMPVPELLPDVERSERRVPGPAGAPDVRVLVYRPRAQQRSAPGYLHIHGGGYVIGTPEGNQGSNQLLASELGCVVVSVDYRLAPETTHPGPVEDCYAALKWMHTHAEELGVDPSRIAVGGESAGGGLAAGLALLARDRGEIQLAFQLLIYPMIDDRTVTHADPHPFVGEFIWTRDSNRFGWTSLLGTAPGADGVSPYAAASRAADLTGLPPTFISVGALDLFLEEDLEYARRLMRAGVPTELHVYPGAYHAFNLVPDADVTKRYVRDLTSALKRGLRAVAAPAPV